MPREFSSPRSFRLACARREYATGVIQREKNREAGESVIDTGGFLASFFFLFFFFYKPLYKTARLPSLFALAATSRADEQSATPRRVHVFRALHVSETGGKSTACCENELIATLDERKATEVIDHRRLFIFFFPFPFLRAKNEIEISTSIFLREITSKRTSRSAR